MTKIMNQGIISIGNQNVNTVTNNNSIPYEEILNELYILNEKCPDNINDLIMACKLKNYMKFISGIKCLGKGTIHIIKELGLPLLLRFIEKHF